MIHRDKELWDSTFASEKRQIPFSDLKELFDPQYWDVGVITEDELLQVALMPIKSEMHQFGVGFANNISYDGICNALILARSGHTWDYTHYKQAVKIMRESQYDRWFPCYTNFKEAALRAGIGVRARNSLIYNYQFGFDVHFCAIAIYDEITDFPQHTRHNKKMWSRCTDCMDCMTQCPVNAIKNDVEPNWLNSSDCDRMIGFGIPERPDIPSIKNFWHKNLFPEIPQEEIDKVWDKESLGKLLKKMGQKSDDKQFVWDRNGYSFDGQVIRDIDGDAVQVPLCRECTSQPTCSKWDGNYPYDKMKGKINGG